MNFNQKVWDLTKRIPKGKVTTYKEIANRLKTKAYRAVGNAMNKNPYAPKVPCHRVINSDGYIGQFAKGIKAKMRMLKSEGIFIDKDNFVDLKKYMFKLK